MSAIVIAGTGVVSPAGWGTEALWSALQRNEPLPTESLLRPGWEQGLTVRAVPKPAARPAFLAHARLRRTSPISQFVVAAALEALGADEATLDRARLGIIVCVMSGCVNYSRRFYSEVLADPATASPLVFPETVFNAPSSHLAAVLGCQGINYTLVGDPGTFAQGLALGATWLARGQVDGCLIIGAEEKDWLTSDAGHLFGRSVIFSDGAGAIYLQRAGANQDGICLNAVTDAHSFNTRVGRRNAAARMRAQFPAAGSTALLCDGLTGSPRWDAEEQAAWSDWSCARLSPKRVLGEGLMAAAAWQCVAAIKALGVPETVAANVSIIGCNQQAVGVQFVRGAITS